MNELDENLIYGGARRISEYEAELLDQIDDISDAQINMQTNLKRALETEKSKLEKTDKAIEMYCMFFWMVKLVTPPVSWWNMAVLGLPMTTTASAEALAAPPA